MGTSGWALLAIGLVATAGCFGLGEDDATAALRTSQPAAYLWSSPYPDLLIEIDHVEGARPSDFAVDALVEMLREETNKRSITVAPYEEMPAFGSHTNGKRWTTQQLVALATEKLDHAPAGSYGADETAVLHILYIDGSYDGEYGDGVIGLAIGATAFLFDDPALADTSGIPKIFKPFIERSVLIHEVGHVLGLVNIDLPMQTAREDADSPHHSTNPESVMYSGIDGLKSILGTVDAKQAPPHRFDEHDKADLRAFRDLEPNRA